MINMNPVDLSFESEWEYHPMDLFIWMLNPQLAVKFEEVF